MSNSPQEQNDKNVRKVGLDTETIFLKYPSSYSPDKDISKDVTTDDTDLITAIDPVRSNSHTTDDSTKHSSARTESSSETSRKYKFICIPTECDNSGEEESFKLSPVCYEAEKTKDTIDVEPDIEYTLAIIKPEAMIYRTEIEDRIYAEGFEIYQIRWLQLTPEQVSQFYDNHFGELSFPRLVAYMSSGSILVFVLAKQNAVEEWKMLMGPPTVTDARLYFPDSIRARYGRKGETFKNVVHGSDSREQAEKEIHFFFPDFIIEPLFRDESAEDFLWDVINPILVEGLTLCCKSKPIDPISWLANWLLLNNPNKPKLPENLALIPT